MMNEQQWEQLIQENLPDLAVRTSYDALGGLESYILARKEKKKFLGFGYTAYTPIADLTTLPIEEDAFSNRDSVRRGDLEIRLFVSDALQDMSKLAHAYHEQTGRPYVIKHDSMIVETQDASTPSRA
ncbi:MAG: hypothetical protein V1725_03770 [archaeon]